MTWAVKVDYEKKWREAEKKIALLEARCEGYTALEREYGILQKKLAEVEAIVSRRVEPADPFSYSPFDATVWYDRKAIEAMKDYTPYSIRVKEYADYASKEYADYASYLWPISLEEKKEGG